MFAFIFDMQTHMKERKQSIVQIPLIFLFPYAWIDALFWPRNKTAQLNVTRMREISEKRRLRLSDQLLITIIPQTISIIHNLKSSILVQHC